MNERWTINDAKSYFEEENLQNGILYMSYFSCTWDPLLLFQKSEFQDEIFTDFYIYLKLMHELDRNDAKKWYLTVILRTRVEYELIADEAA
jgi:hypothetical protein